MSKKELICQHVDNLPYNDRLHILQILKQHLPLDCIIEHADGCRISIDKLDIEFINKLYHIINNKIQCNESDPNSRNSVG